MSRCNNNYYYVSSFPVGAYNDDRVDAVMEGDQLSSFVIFLQIVASCYPNVGDIAQYISDSDLLITSQYYFFFN